MKMYLFIQNKTNKAPWLFVECYVYRRIREALLASISEMREYDAFEISKEETHEKNEKSVFQMIQNICPLYMQSENVDINSLQNEFKTIIEVIYRKLNNEKVPLKIDTHLI